MNKTENCPNTEFFLVRITPYNMIHDFLNLL